MEVFKGNKGNIRMFCIGFSLASLIGIGLVFNFSKEARVTNVYIDMDRIITEITRSIAEQELTGQKLESAIESYRSALSKELAAYTSKHKVIIFSSPKPISGADNKTEFFLEKLKSAENSTFIRGSNLEDSRTDSTFAKEAEAMGEMSQENAQEVTNQSSTTSELLDPNIKQNDTLNEGEKSAKEDEKPVKAESTMDNTSPAALDTLNQPNPVQLTELSKER